MARARGSRDDDSPPWLEPAALSDDEDGPVLSRKWIVGGAAVFVIALVGTVIAVSSGEEEDPYGNAIVAGADGGPPLIVAPKEPYRVAPKDPGGMRADGEGLMIGEVASGKELNPDVKLATGPEQPVERPAPPPVAEAAPLLPPEAEAAMAAPQAPKAAPKAAEPAPVAPKTEIAKADTAKAEAARAQAEKAEAARLAAEKAEAEKAAAAARAEAARKQAEAEAKAKAEAAKKPVYFLQLGAFSSVDRAQAGWQEFAAKYSKELESLGPDVQPVRTGDKTMYRLRAGPISLKARADSLCGKLKAAGQPCLVAER